MQSAITSTPRPAAMRAPREARRHEKVLAGHVGRVTSVAFSSDGELVATGGEDGTVRLWRSRVGTVIRTIRAHRKAVTSVQFSHDGDRVFSAGADRALKVWVASTGAPVGQLGGLLGGHRRPITSLSLSPDGFQLLTGAADNSVKLWDLESGGVRRTHRKCHPSKVLTVAFSRDGTIVATGGDSGAIRLFDHRPLEFIKRDGPLPTLDPLPGLAEIVGLAFSPDGSLVAAAGHVKSEADDDSPRAASRAAFGVWRRNEGHLFKEFPGTRGSGVCFSPDGRYLAAADAYDASQVLRMVDGMVVATYATARFVAFSPDGTLVALGGEDDIVRLHAFDPLH